MTTCAWSVTATSGRHEMSIKPSPKLRQAEDELGAILFVASRKLVNNDGIITDVAAPLGLALRHEYAFLNHRGTQNQRSINVVVL